MNASVTALVAATVCGDRTALARLLTVVETGGDDGIEAVVLAKRAARAAGIVGVTGPPGVGKSSLTDRLIDCGRRDGSAVSVLAVDPSSPYSGGAILGDRVRMHRHDLDEGVFVRSLGTRGRRGGLSRSAPDAATMLEAAGFRWVLIETVGVGQVELDIAGSSDTVVVVLHPGWGDAVQVHKAGILEIGDIFVINKADRDGAADAVRELEGMLSLRRSIAGAPASWTPPVIQTVAVDGLGVDAVWEAVLAHRGEMTASGELLERRRRRSRDQLRSVVFERFEIMANAVCTGEHFDGIADRLAARDVDAYTATKELLDLDGASL